MKDKLPISEMFFTIQGEGRFAGVPSFFIRTSGCNLRCWWCDTPYTSWKPEMTWTPLTDIIDQAIASGAPHIVLTGGEPMLYPEQMAYLCGAFAALGNTVTIETNGTVFDEGVRPTLWSVSPKLKSSAPTKEDQRNEFLLHDKNNCPEVAAFRDMAVLKNNVQFKFVASSPDDIAEIEQTVDFHAIPPEMVWIMPEGITREVMLERGPWAAEICKAKKWNLCLRQHVLLWGAKRGV